MGPLTVLTAALERRDPYTRGHCDRVTTLARTLAAQLACDRAELASIELGGPVHDIGKLSVPDDVLLKPGRLDEDELEQIRTHPTEGARILRGIRSLRAAVPCVLHHHERWDGGGYPAGLAGEEIPKPARILAVADAFDAMTSARPYRDALPVAVALEEVRRCAGTQFDPEVSAAFVAWAAA